MTSEYTPREGSVAEKAITELGNGPRWIGDLANELGIETTTLGPCIKVAIDAGAVNQVVSESGRQRVLYLPGEHAAALALFQQRVDERPQASAEPAPPPARKAKAEKLQRQAAKPAKAAKVVPAKRAKRTSTSLPVAAPAIEAAPVSNGEQLAVTEGGEIIVLKDDRVTHRLPPELVVRITTVATRLQARRA